MLAVTSKKMIQPRESAYIIEVKKFLLLCAPKFFRRSVRMLYLSQKKKTYTKMISRMPCRFVANMVKPNSIPNKIMKNIARIIP